MDRGVGSLPRGSHSRGIRGGQAPAEKIDRCDDWASRFEQKRRSDRRWARSPEHAKSDVHCVDQVPSRGPCAPDLREARYWDSSDGESCECDSSDVDSSDGSSSDSGSSDDDSCSEGDISEDNSSSDGDASDCDSSDGDSSSEEVPEVDL